MVEAKVHSNGEPVEYEERWSEDRKLVLLQRRTRAPCEAAIEEDNFGLDVARNDKTSPHLTDGDRERISITIVVLLTWAFALR